MNLLGKFDQIATEQAAARTRAKWSPLTKRQCAGLIGKYPDDHQLWDRFWQYMADKSAQGMPFESMLASYRELEQAWQRKQLPYLFDIWSAHMQI